MNTQGEADVYVQVYKALLADRREILVAERTALAEHESREKKKRKKEKRKESKGENGNLDDSMWVEKEAPAAVQNLVSVVPLVPNESDDVDGKEVGPQRGRKRAVDFM